MVPMNEPCSDNWRKKRWCTLRHDFTAGGGAAGHQASVMRQAGGGMLPGGLADVLEDDVDTAFSG